jgi:hypothetical protein
MEWKFGGSGMTDGGCRGEVLTDHRDATNEVRSMPLITAKRVSVRIESPGAQSSRMPGRESKRLVTVRP